MSDCISRKAIIDRVENNIVPHVSGKTVILMKTIAVLV